MAQKQHAIVWRFEDAPDELKTMSQHGGDEDWLVEMPIPMWNDNYLKWLEVTDSMGEPSKHDHPTKPEWLVFIGAHA